MQIELVQCLVKLKLNDRNDMMQIVKAGPDAVPATEIPILRAKHDIASGMVQEECAISDAQVVGTVETTKAQEMERLILKYGKRIVDQMYPQGRLMPMTLAECDLPPGCAVSVKPKKAKAKAKDEPVDSPDFDREFWINELREAGTKIPEGNLSEADIWALVDEAGLLGTETAA